jgi:molecular chaperone GrpE
MSNNPTADAASGPQSDEGRGPGGSAESSPETEPTRAETETEAELLRQLQSDLDRFRDLALRSQADFENFRKRAAREKEDAVKYANASFLERLIPILDNFELGLGAARSNEAASSIVSGMEMVARQLNDFLLQNGVEPVEAEGAPFDPNVHEAIAQEEHAQIHEGHVIRQLRKGFRLRDRLLRPATVVVSKGPAA